MRVFGIDLGVNNTGFVVVDTNDKWKVIHSEIISPKEEVPENIWKSARKSGRKGELLLLDPTAASYYLNFLSKKISSVVKAYSPDYIIVEKPDMRPIYPRRTQAVLFMLYSVILLSAFKHRIPLESPTKGVVSKSLGVKSSSSYKERKKIVIDRYKDIDFGVPKSKMDHVADALAVIESFLSSKTKREGKNNGKKK